MVCETYFFSFPYDVPVTMIPYFKKNEKPIKNSENIQLFDVLPPRTLLIYHTTVKQSQKPLLTFQQQKNSPT